MERTIRSWLVPLFLTVGCISLFTNILNVKDVNNYLIGNHEKEKADLRVVTEASMYCTIHLEIKNVEMKTKDEQLASLSAQVKKHTDEKNHIQVQFNQLQGQMNMNKANYEQKQVDNQLARIHDQLNKLQMIKDNPRIGLTRQEGKDRRLNRLDTAGKQEQVEQVDAATLLEKQEEL